MDKKSLSSAKSVAFAGSFRPEAKKETKLLGMKEEREGKQIGDFVLADESIAVLLQERADQQLDFALELREVGGAYFGKAATLAEDKRVKTREEIGANFAV